MQRRQVLVALGALGSLAGCASAPRVRTRTTVSRSAKTSPSPTTTTNPTSGPGTTETTTTTPAPTVGEPAPLDRCPTYDEVTRIVCSDADASTNQPLVVESSTEAVALPTDTIAFTLTNGTEAAFETNFLSWRIHKRVGGDWYHVAPRTWGLPAHTLMPGDSHTWTVTVDNTSIDSPLGMPDSSEAATVVGLGGGEYAFGLDGDFEGDDRRTAVVTRFRVEGDQLELTPTRNVEVEIVEGDTLRAVESAPEDDGPWVTLTVTRVEDSGVPPGQIRPVITEQLVRWTMTRNAVALLRSHDVRAVRIEGPQHVAPVYDLNEPAFVRHDGTTYRLEADREVP